ncbi:MAG: flagellar assembly protein FliX [Alphaproteobacteria bacterium]|nr:flagellar assembly protein FliX [Alphaproteobacteria bacterium]
MISKIDGTGSIRPPTTVRRAAKTSGSGKTSFSSHLEEADAPDGAAATQSAGALGTVTGVLGIQEVDDALARASKGKKRAEDILDRLEDLRIDLLTGALSRDKLQQLARLTNTRRQEVTDPYLAGLLDEIDLRAQVELAKFTPSHSDP